MQQQQQGTYSRNNSISSISSSSSRAVPKAPHQGVQGPLQQTQPAQQQAHWLL
jgi:hypothetical protein